MNYLRHFLMSLLAFLMPIKGIIIAVGLAILADTITGIIKARKTKEEITSRKLSNIVSKMVLYQSAVILFFIIEKFILADILMMFINIEFLATKLVALTLISIELKSVNENVKATTGLSLWERFKTMLNRVKEVKQEVKDLKD